jgi:hypothetical protein
MYLPSQEKALASLQCLDILEKTGEMPSKKDGPLCLNAEKWSPEKLLYHIAEFVDIEEPAFYEGQLEQNSLLAEETIRELINKDDMLGETYEILLDYSQEIPEPKTCQIILPENKTIDIQSVNPDNIPNIWVWDNAQVIFVSTQALLKDPRGKKLCQTLETMKENDKTAPDAIVVYELKKKTKKSPSDEFPIIDDIWYCLPEDYQKNGLGWLGRNHMCVEQCIEILNRIKTPYKLDDNVLHIN